jgi:hypothetical protein
MRRILARALASLILLAAPPSPPAPAPGAGWPTLGRDATRDPVSPEQDAPTGWQIPHRDGAAHVFASTG